MRILVTGAGGYIGRHVVSAFLEKGHEVWGSDFSFKGIDDRVRIMEEPIFSGDKNIYQTMGSPDVLVHLAWRDGFIHNSDAHMKDLSSHMTFIKNMVDGGLPSLTVMGSAHEVGYWEGAVDEDTPCRPLSMYGIAKNALRQAVLLYTADKDVTTHWLRGFYIYGDDARGSSVFAKLYQAVQDGKEEFPFTSGKNRYDFLHIKELASQIAAASTQNQINGIINVCSGKAVPLGDFVEQWLRENNFRISLQYGAYPDRPYDSPALWGNNEKIRRIMEANA